MDADVAGELSSLRADLGAAQSVLNNWRLNGLETLTQQRAFTFGNQKVRNDNYGIQVRASDATTFPFINIVNTLVANPTTLTVPHATFEAQINPTNTKSAGFAYQGATGSNPQASWLLQTTATSAGAELDANYSGSVAAYGKAAADSTGLAEFQVSPTLKLVGVTVDPTTVSDGDEWYRSDLFKFRGRNNGATVNFVTSDATADDLTQYALLAGRATPQQLNFGTASGAATGYLSSTANATKGKYGLNAALTMVVDDLNVRLGVGTGSPSDAVHTTGSFRSDSNVALNNYFANQFGATLKTFQSRGSVASPTASQSGDQVMVLNGQSCISAGTYSANAIGYLQLTTAEVQNSTHYGADWSFQACPLATTVPVEYIGFGATIAGVKLSQNVILGGSGKNVGFYGSGGGLRTTQGAGVTNNVTSGGTANQLDNWTSLAVYATDAAAIRNAVYQLGVLMANVIGCLRTVNLMS